MAIAAWIPRQLEDTGTNRDRQVAAPLKLPLFRGAGFDHSRSYAPSRTFLSRPCAPSPCAGRGPVPRRSAAPFLPHHLLQQRPETTAVELLGVPGVGIRLPRPFALIYPSSSATCSLHLCSTREPPHNQGLKLEGLGHISSQPTPNKKCSLFTSCRQTISPCLSFEYGPISDLQPNVNPSTAP